MAEVIRNERPLVFEEMARGFEEMTHLKETTKYSGCLHQERNHLLRAVHIVHPAWRQVYFASRLDITPHYHLPDDLGAFVEKATILVGKENVHFYEPNKSYNISYAPH